MKALDINTDQVSTSALMIQQISFYIDPYDDYRYLQSAQSNNRITTRTYLQKDMRGYTNMLDSRSSKIVVIITDWLGICTEQVSNF